MEELGFLVLTMLLLLKRWGVAMAVSRVSTVTSTVWWWVYGVVFVLWCCGVRFMLLLKVVRCCLCVCVFRYVDDMCWF